MKPMIRRSNSDILILEEEKKIETEYRIYGEIKLCIIYINW